MILGANLCALALDEWLEEFHVENTGLSGSVPPQVCHLPALDDVRADCDKTRPCACVPIARE